MKWVSYGMLIFTIIMGFALPAAMGIYWGIGALISMIQTWITQSIMLNKQAKEKRL
jgi:membrane protein insertase Oxa1/YidC/SpoIIIJ